MAKTLTAQKELTFAERLTQALNGIEQAQTMIAEAQAAYDQAKAALTAELKNLPADHPLRLLTSSNGAAKPVGSAGKRTRSSKEDLERIKESILDQLQGKGKMGRKDFDMLDVQPQTFMNQVSALVEAGAVKKEGEKASTRYWIAGKK